MATALYIFSGWLLFNVVFAVGMYFRPVRKRAAGSTDDYTLEPVSNPRSFDDLGAQRRVPGLRKGNGGPAALSKVLFFGFWLRDRRGSV